MNRKPVFLNYMRVERTYTGGKLLDEWQGVMPAEDGWKPEEWIASVVRSRFAENPDTGLSVIRSGEFQGMFLKDYISGDPENILGAGHYEKYGEDPGFLAKVIDSNNRLNIQTHPDRKKAKEYFDSDYGKTEAWYVMGTRMIDEEEPYILLGFKQGITKEKWIRLIESQDRRAMVESLHKIPVKKGDAFIVNSGVPHAIGSGCMIAEVQEPTDFSFRVEKIVSEDKVFPEETYHQGIGYDKMYDCFDYTGYSIDEVLNEMKLPAGVKEKTDDYSIRSILRTEDTPYFSMEKINVSRKWKTLNDKVFCVAFVLAGSGILSSDGKEYPLNSGDELFLPCSPDELVFQNSGDGKLEFLLCFPPDRITT